MNAQSQLWRAIASSQDGEIPGGDPSGTHALGRIVSCVRL